jgi:hypothetical protein
MTLRCCGSRTQAKRQLRSAFLEANASKAGIGEIFYGRSLETMFNSPGLPATGGDPRTPGIIVQPNVGVVYTGSLSKQPEHSGFAHDDTNVMLLIANPNLRARKRDNFSLRRTCTIAAPPLPSRHRATLQSRPQREGR